MTFYSTNQFHYSTLLLLTVSEREITVKPKYRTEIEIEIWKTVIAKINLIEVSRKNTQYKGYSTMSLRN